jgi:hypothetical protein
MRALVIAGTVFLMTACEGFVGEGTGESAEQLVSTWSLAAVDGKSPSDVNIESWRLTLKSDGTWSYSGEMDGAWRGMQLTGDGRWKVVAPGQMEYTAGDNRGTLTYRLAKDTLMLTPDPVIASSSGAAPSMTSYERVAVTSR